VEGAFASDVIEASSNRIPLPQSIDALRRLLNDGDIEGRAYQWRRVLDAETRTKHFSEGEIEDLRCVLLESACIATAVCGFDAGISRRSEDLRIRVVDAARRKLGMPPTLRDRYRHALPFDEFAPSHLLFDLDKWAQRIRLGADGSPVVEAMCKVEHAAARVLTRGVLETSPSLRAGSLWVRALIRERSTHTVLGEVQVSVPQVFAVLALAQSGGRFIELHKRAGINIARMCSMVDRAAGTEVAVQLQLMDKNAASRLEDLGEWAARFDVGGVVDLSPDQSADLARLLIDAQRVLAIMDSVRDAVVGAPMQSRWRSMWRRAISDPEVRVGLRLSQSGDRIVSCDFGQALRLARAGTFALGYSLEDDVEAGWRTRSNPVQSLAWLFSQVGQVPDLSLDRKG
jgi:hypothetical protein